MLTIVMSSLLKRMAKNRKGAMKKHSKNVLIKFEKKLKMRNGSEEKY